MNRTTGICRLFKIVFFLCLSTLLFPSTSSADAENSYADLRQKLAPLIGHRDAVAVISPDGAPVVAIHADQLLVPASILKTLTASAALYHLGKEFRYTTDFYLDGRRNLKIKGYGDPLLVSERLDDIARQLAEKIKKVNGLILDDHYFAYPIFIPGRGTSAEPYDAPNGALCVNFNTVFFKKENGHWTSAEPQTPLLPLIIPKIEASGLQSGRITLAAGRDESLVYTGALFNFFLNKAGIQTDGTVQPGRIDPSEDQLLWRYRSAQPLTEIIADLMEFSNNFIANQLLLTMGAKVYGAPATMENGLKVLRTYYSDVLGLTTGTIAEGSGISRQNRISASNMLKILDHFAPYRHLMRQKGRQWYKTGTLKGVHTRAGYLDSARGGQYRFVVMLNTRGKLTDQIMRVLERELK